LEMRHVMLTSRQMLTECSEGELRYGWLREPTDIEKRLLLPL